METNSVDKDVEEFLRYAQESRVNLSNWEKALVASENNSNKLLEEMRTTIREVNDFVTAMEEQAKMRKFRRRTYGSGEWSDYIMREKHFGEGIVLGQDVMKKLIDAITEGPEPIIEEPIITLHGKDPDAEKDPVRRLAVIGYKLLERFGRVLEGEGVVHNYPIVKIIPRKKRFRMIVNEEAKSTTKESVTEGKERKIQYSLASKTSRTTNYGPHVEEPNRTPGAFVRDYAEQNKLDLEYKEISAVNNTWTQEYIYTCRLHKLACEGKGKRRSIAKQSAAAHMLKLLLGRQRKKTLPPDMPPLNDKEKQTALQLSCENVEYGLELQNLCCMENSRAPIYTAVIQASGNAVRCKAMGFNAVGHGRTKEVARRMAAKLVLDQHFDEKERHMDKFLKCD